eukprot:g833.t1
MKIFKLDTFIFIVFVCQFYHTFVNGDNTQWSLQESTGTIVVGEEYQYHLDGSEVLEFDIFDGKTKTSGKGYANLPGVQSNSALSACHGTKQEENDVVAVILTSDGSCQVVGRRPLSNVILGEGSKGTKKNEGKEVSLIYGKGELCTSSPTNAPQEAHVVYRCDSKITEGYTTKGVVQKDCDWYFYVYSAKACPTKLSRGVNGWVMFFLIAIGGMSLYLVSVYLVNVYFFGASGFEALPLMLKYILPRSGFSSGGLNASGMGTDDIELEDGTEGLLADAITDDEQAHDKSNENIGNVVSL